MMDILTNCKGNTLENSKKWKKSFNLNWEFKSMNYKKEKTYTLTNLWKIINKRLINLRITITKSQETI